MKLSFLLNTLVGWCSAFQLLPTAPRIPLAGGLNSMSSGDYLSTLSSGGIATASPPPPSSQQQQQSTTPEPASNENAMATLAHAPLSYFAIDKLTPKGPRKNPDVGQPHDATRPLVKAGALSAGSWWCAQGGWPSPSLRTTTEWFMVFSGSGAVTDLDGTRHEFGPGDTVVLPKGWSGRWDILEPIHKVWAVHDHPNVEESSNPIRAVITPARNFAPPYLIPDGLRPDATLGAPCTASQTTYDVGSTKTGCWTCTSGSFPVFNHPTTECFHVLEGDSVLTNADGSAQRCVTGDTVVLPKGWTGHWDVVETVKKLWVVVE